MNILVTDFDGTLTRHDFFELVRARWPSPPGDDPWDKYVAGTLTHFEALAKIFRQIRTSEGSLLELADAMELDPEAASAIRTLEAEGWLVIVASAGCDWYIRHHLGPSRAGLAIHANPGTFDTAEGLLMSLPDQSRFFSPETGVDKVAIMHDAITRADQAAFAGDGRPDLPAALLVPPERRFARGWLAGELDRLGEKFHRFEHWSEIGPQLFSTAC